MADQGSWGFFFSWGSPQPLGEALGKVLEARTLGGVLEARMLGGALEARTPGGAVTL